MSIKGIDISKWQYESVLDNVQNTDIRFVIIKAGGDENGFYTDERFTNHYNNAKSKNLLVGAYYYGVPLTVERAIEEASHFVGLLADKSFELPVFFDIEDASTLSLSETEVYNIISAFCSIVNNAISNNNVKAPSCGFYTYDGYIWYHRNNSSLASLTQSYPFWYANINSYAESHMGDMRKLGFNFYMHQYNIGYYTNLNYNGELDKDEIVTINFNPRKTPPIPTDKYIKFYNNDKNNGISPCMTGLYSTNQRPSYYKYANVLPNCTGYAVGRFNEIYSQVNDLSANIMYYAGLNTNAGGILAKAKQSYSSLAISESINATPKVGAMIVLSIDSNASTNTSARGHALIIENVIDDSTIEISESGYFNSDTMRYSTWHKDSTTISLGSVWDNSSNYYGKNGYKFVGMIYNPAIIGSMYSSNASLTSVTLTGITS